MNDYHICRVCGLRKGGQGMRAGINHDACAAAMKKPDSKKKQRTYSDAESLKCVRYLQRNDYIYQEKQ